MSCSRSAVRGRWPQVPVHKFRTGAPSWGLSVHCTFSAALIKGLWTIISFSSSLSHIGPGMVFEVFQHLTHWMLWGWTMPNFVTVPLSENIEEKWSDSEHIGIPLWCAVKQMLTPEHCVRPSTKFVLSLLFYLSTGSPVNQTFIFNLLNKKFHWT